MHNGLEILALFLAAIYGYVFWIVYLMVAKPVRFVDFMVRRPYRWWGLVVTVEDEAKLKRRARIAGVLTGLFVAAHATLVGWAVMSGKR